MWMINTSKEVDEMAQGKWVRKKRETEDQHLR